MSSPITTLEPSNETSHAPASSSSKSSPAADALARTRKQEEKKRRFKRMLHAKRKAPTPLTVSVASVTELHLQQWDSGHSLTAPPSARGSSNPIFVIPPASFEWSSLRTVPCPYNNCRCALDPSALLAHFVMDHMPGTGLPLVELKTRESASLSVNIGSLERNVNLLLGVFTHRCEGLNPLVCDRNVHLPMRYRQYSQHDALMVFACRTKHSMLWHRSKKKGEVVAIWVSTPQQRRSVYIRLAVQAEQSKRTFSKQVKARPIQPEEQPCRQFIKMDPNVIIVSFDDLQELSTLDVWQQLIKVELKVLADLKN